MLSNWFRSRDVDEFADRIVEELRGRFPPGGSDSEPATPGKRIQRLQKTHRAIFSRVEAFARSSDLSVYRKARLGNRVKWALTEAGYERAFVDAFVQELVTLLALAPRAGKGGGRLKKIGNK